MREKIQSSARHCQAGTRPKGYACACAGTLAPPGSERLARQAFTEQEQSAKCQRGFGPLPSSCRCVLRALCGAMDFSTEHVVAFDARVVQLLGGLVELGGVLGLGG